MKNTEQEKTRFIQKDNSKGEIMDRIVHACAGVTPSSHDAAPLTMKTCQVEVK